MGIFPGISRSVQSMVCSACRETSRDDSTKPGTLFRLRNLSYFVGIPGIEAARQTVSLLCASYNDR